MEEIRKRRLVRGIACALWGCARPEGVGRAALRASADVLSIVNAPSLSSHERKPQTVGETASIEIASSQGQGAASLSTTWIVRRVRQPRATLVIFDSLHGFLYLPERGVSGISAGQIVMLLFLGEQAHC